MREQPLKHGSRTRIKICGLTRPEDIQAVNQAKPDFAGFIVEFPKSRRNVTVEQLKALREELDDSILPVGVFVNAPVELPAQLLNEGTIALAQLHGQEDDAESVKVHGKRRPALKGHRRRSKRPCHRT